MKKSVFIIFFFSSVLSMSARPNNIGDDARLNKSYKYEGSVSIGYSWAVTLNLETVHGVRFSGSNVFIGGQAGLSFGIPQGVGSYVRRSGRTVLRYSAGRGLLCKCASQMVFPLQ